MLLITINKTGTVIFHPDVLKMEPTLAKLTDQEAMLVILAYDTYSPFRQLSEQERTRRAWAQVFRDKKKNPFDEPKIKEAVSVYCSLQYDERREQVSAYLAKIATINQAIRDAESPSEIKRLVDTNKILRDAVNKIEEELFIDEEKDSNAIQGKAKLSLLERLMRNKEKYAEVIKSKENRERHKIEREAEGS